MLAALVGSQALFLAGSAHAATGASVNSGQLVILAVAGKANSVTVDTSGSYVVVTDTGDTIAPGAGCSTVTAHQIRCTSAAITSVAVSTGDLDDKVVIMLDLPATLNGGSGDDTLGGGAGDDSLAGGTGDDVLDGGEGDDTAVASSGYTTDGADTFNGGPGLDTASYQLRGWPVSVSLDAVANDGSGDNDNIKADVENIAGGSGDDVLTGSDSGNTLHGNGGDDIVAGGAGPHDELFGDSGDDSVIGGPDDDLAVGGTGNDYLVGGAGEDLLAGSGGNDRVFGQGGPDRVTGQEGDDELYGGADDDILIAGAGDDLQDGGDGDDYFGGSYSAEWGDNAGGSDKDTFIGGAGTGDEVSYAFGQFPIVADIDGVADDGVAGEQDNIGTDIERLTGSDAADLLTASATGSHLYGGAGDDTLRGRGGPDRLYGGNGDDALNSLDNIWGNDGVDGGFGTDTCSTDPLDTRVLCEP